MNARFDEPWLEANQRALAAGFVRLRRRLQPADPNERGHDNDRGEAQQGEPQPGPTPAGEPPAIDRLARTFGLSAFERDVLLLAAGIELDTQLAGAVAAAQRARHGLPSFGLALAALDGAHWSALSPHRPLRRWRLVELDEAQGLTQAALRVDERILQALAGIDDPDVRLRPLLQPLAQPPLRATSQATAATLLVRQLDRLREQAPCVLLHGDDADGHCDVAATVAAELGLSAYRLDARDIPALPAEQETLATLWQREAALSGAALFIDARPESHRQAAVDPAALARWLQRIEGGLAFVSVEEPLPGIDGLPVRIDKPPPDEQLSLWQQALGQDAQPATTESAALPAIAAQYRLSARTIARRAQSLSDIGTLQAHCRTMARPPLDGLAQRVEASACWADLVLPPAQMQTLHLIAGQLRHRATVHGDWGFSAQGPRGLGLSALFFGESGVGKTLACEVLANELDLDLYRIDLSAVVSKYIRETEKNLKRVFDAAQDCGAILLFDEADALFGKRSEVKDSHDRYANIEVSYLLQRMEAYSGLAVLTTNQRGALDPAFLRRLRFVVQFPFPDAAQREQIWARVFPPAMPRHELDLARLARLPLPGGQIRNIALNAAFIAAADSSPVRMGHLARAAHLEAAKHERPLAETQTRGWT